MNESGKVKLPFFRCLRCGHTWVPRKVDRPVTCPQCRSAYWDRPKLNVPKAEGGSEVGKAS